MYPDISERHRELFLASLPLSVMPRKGNGIAITSTLIKRSPEWVTWCWLTTLLGRAKDYSTSIRKTERPRWARRASTVRQEDRWCCWAQVFRFTGPGMGYERSI